MCTNNRGFTLIELMTAMVIMTIGLLGLLQTVNFALQHNTTNQMRNDAVLVADELMALEEAKSFDLISTNTTHGFVTRTVYNAFKNYSVTKTGAGVSATTKSVVILVNWNYKGVPYTHNISSLISKSSQ